ncbi:LA_3334 family protein [Leptospira dzoumogneensis]|uniref:Uncharacterized protein n=1 Tax=Leptospira dzoumogneensis TaxID=2484904 RepID=A0A4Z1AH72_9LEPT|nr:hypothetical protein [Leptospira dzoumogneensis]TGM97318.1 hypothetical protein EHR06_14310 [Leptospira dzoumogneensis]
MRIKLQTDARSTVTFNKLNITSACSAGVCVLLFLLSYVPVFAAEILLQNGSAFIVKEVSEKNGKVFTSWKSHSYSIPKEDILRIDPSKIGPENSYTYTIVTLSDGTEVRGILVERAHDTIVLKTDQGFVSLESSKILKIHPSDNFDLKPELSEVYLVSSSSNDWRLGLQLSGNASLGSWANLFPQTYGAGGFIEKSWGIKNSFAGFQSDYSYGNSSNGKLSIWSQTFYYGKSFGNSAPYILFGIGASSISWTSSDRSRGGVDPSVLLEFGWNWDKPGRYIFRLGPQVQCAIESDSNLCRVGVRFSWGLYL